MEDLKVIANLLDGRIATTDGFLPLDSILYNAYAKKYRPDLLENPISSYNDIIHFPIPIEKITIDERIWYYDCSFALFDILGEDRRFFNKRYDMTLAEKYADFKGKSSNVNTQRAKFKNWRIPLNIVLTSKIEWYLKGDKKELEELLKYASNIGKKSSQGIGIVKDWIVEPTKEKLSKLRPIPDANGDDEIAIHPLYFDPNNVMKVILPNDRRLGCIQLYDRW